MPGMKRREFVALLGGAAATRPRAARAQQGERLRRIGVLTGGDAERAERIGALTQRLEELGWDEGRNLRIDVRAGGGVESWAAQAVALVASDPDVIVVVANPGLESD